MERRLNILDPAFSRHRYIELLKRFFGFYAPLEGSIPAYGAGSIHWLDGDRRKASLLQADLRWAGLSEQELTDLPRCQRLPDVHSFARQLGCMYVLEGATLGGQVVVRHLCGRLAITGGDAFFSSYREQVGGMWRAFCKRLESASGDQPTRSIIIDSACATFAALDAWIDAMPVSDTILAGLTRSATQL